MPDGVGVFMEEEGRAGRKELTGQDGQGHGAEEEDRLIKSPRMRWEGRDVGTNYHVAQRLTSLKVASDS